MGRFCVVFVSVPMFLVAYAPAYSPSSGLNAPSSASALGVKLRASEGLGQIVLESAAD